MPISADDVAWVYRLLLGRPARPQEIATWRAAASVEELRERCLDSAEFRGAMRRRGLDRPPTPPPAPLPLDIPAPQVDWQADTASLARLLERITRTWTALGEDRPHWSVLSSEQFLPERIEATRSAFYASGAGEARRVLGALERHGVSARSHRRLLEYGCGVGRATPHLAQHFDVTAVDISATHLDHARDATEAAGALASFRLARAPDFGMVEPFDVWFSYIVLQHNPPPVIAMVLRRALSMLAAGGIAIFQLPTHALGYRFDLAEYLGAAPKPDAIEVHCLPQSVVFRIAAEAGCVPLEMREDTAMGPPSHWLSNSFVFAKLG